MTKQTWTAVVSALCFVACALVATLAPVPFVVWSPGQTTNLLADEPAEVVQVTGDATTYPTSGRLLLASLSQTPPQTKVTLVDALYSYWASDRDVLPRYAVYPAGAGQEAVAEEAQAAFDTSELDATAAALRTAGIEVQPTPVVDNVNATGPSAGRLRVHDLVVAIGYSPGNLTAVQTAAEANAAIASGKVGGQITFSIVRDGVAMTVTVVSQDSKSKPGQPVAGVSFIQGYRYDPKVAFQVDPAIGSAGGLMFALAAFDKVTPDALLADRVVAGAGTIDANGIVSRVSGIRERIIAAERAGASVFLLPSANCSDVAELAPSVRLVPVGSLTEAVAALQALADPAEEGTVKGCA